jgi:SOS-response transcriptional repressor LexA
MKGIISVTDKRVKGKIRDRFAPDSISARIKALRKRIGLDQTALARDIGVEQSTISEWENAKYPPSPMALMALGRLDYDNAAWWYEQAGPRFAERLKIQHLIRDVREEKKKGNDRLVWVPLLHDPVGAGLLRNIAEQDVDSELPFAAELMPSGGRLRAFRVAGDSMAPIVNDGYIVIIDAAQHDPKKLVGQMVAAREGDGVTIKWLRKDKNDYLLVPQHVSPKFPVRIMRDEDDWSVVGVVVKWIGYPSLGK